MTVHVRRRRTFIEWAWDWAFGNRLLYVELSVGVECFGLGIALTFPVAGRSPRLAIGFGFGTFLVEVVDVYDSDEIGDLDDLDDEEIAA
jgi:hypothetical protein